MRVETLAEATGLRTFAVDASGAWAPMPAARAVGEASDVESFGVIHAPCLPLLETAIARHRRAASLGPALTLIVDPAPAPEADTCKGGEVFCLLATADLARRVALAERHVETWCFALLTHVMSKPRLGARLQVVHRNEPPPVRPGDAFPTVEAIAPHRGLERHVRLSLDSLLNQTAPARVVVALDQAGPAPNLLREVRARDDVRLYRSHPQPIGPYPARHHFATTTDADFVLWQDTDDISVPERLETLLAAAEAEGAGVVGSHEIRLHEIRRKVTCERYPLEAGRALERHGAGHQLLFPTTLVRREVVEAVGGLSTHRLFSLDVNFWLAASRVTRLINVDEFLYIRRRRRGSLTLRRDIGSDSEVRRAIRDQRSADYAAVRDGLKPLAETSLAVRHRAEPVEFEDLKTGERRLVRFG